MYDSPMKRHQIYLVIAIITLFTSSAFASKCRVKYEVTIRKSENARRDYFSCTSGSSLYEEQMTTGRSQVSYDLSKKECHQFAQELIGQRIQVQFLEMVVGDEGLYTTCYGEITHIRKIKYKY